MEIGDLVRRKLVRNDHWFETTNGMFLSPAESEEYGIISDIEKCRGWSIPEPHLVVVYWSYTGLCFEDPEDVERVS